jgi:hypothetical protein
MVQMGRMIAGIGLLAAALGAAEPAAAQATRTWVSGVGDDVNPCSRTAPCKTFAGAISKTAAGGAINCIDPGGFGGVTITKSITIACDHVMGGVLVSGATGITVNAAATDSIYLSGLDIFGGGNATHGVRVIGAGTVHVHNSTIRMFKSASSSGVSVQPSTSATVYIVNSTISDNSTGITASGAGAQVIARNSVITSNGTGLAASSGGKLVSAGGNLLSGNATQGAFTGELAPK